MNFVCVGFLVVLFIENVLLALYVGHRLSTSLRYIRERDQGYEEVDDGSLDSQPWPTRTASAPCVTNVKCL